MWLPMSTSVEKRGGERESGSERWNNNERSISREKVLKPWSKLPRLEWEASTAFIS